MTNHPPLATAFSLYLFEVMNTLCIRMFHPVLQSKLPEIETLCKKHDVIRLDVFGSVLREDFNSNSDLDLLVHFKRGESINAFHQYFDFKEAMEKLLERPVDLVCLNAIRNPYFKQEVESTRSPVYAA